MPYSNQPENTNCPDDVQLKSEIDRISARVDHIMETVKTHFAISKLEPTKQKTNEDAVD